MKFLTVRELRTRTREVWEGLESEREMIVTSNGHPIAILSSVDDETLEESLDAIRRARAITAVSELQRRALADGRSSLTEDDIETEIAAARSERRGPAS